jgi:hypothetical protein
MSHPCSMIPTRPLRCRHCSPTGAISFDGGPSSGSPSTPKHGEPLLLLGYAFRLEGGSIRLDNAKVGGVMFAKLTSICVPFSRSNDDDSQGLKVVVVKATQGTRVTLWRNTKSAEGRRTPDERHAELVVRDGKLVRLG